MLWSFQERPGFRVSSLLRRTDNGGAKYEDGEVPILLNPKPYPSKPYTLDLLNPKP